MTSGLETYQERQIKNILAEIAEQQERIAELEADHERAVAMVIEASIATGHAETSADLMAEVLHVVKNLRAENERLRDRLDKFRRATCANCGAGPSTPGKEQP